MRGSAVSVALALVLGFAAPPGAAAQTFVIPIKGDIEPTIAAFVRRESNLALKAGAAFLVYEIDTFGGRVDTALQISSYIGSIKEAKTVAWVRGGPESMGVSWSAGALIAFSCSSIYMAGGTSMGAAAPVIIGADGKAEAAGEKTTSAVRSQMAAIAEKNGHPAAVALAMVDADVELSEIEVEGALRLATAADIERLEKERPGQVVRGPVVSAKGKLLSLTAGEAERYGVSSGTVDDLPSLLAALGSAGEAKELSPSIADRIVSFLVSGPVQTVVILLGLVALFLEINSPGFGIPGVVALVSFLGVFGANALLGSVESLELILFLAGLGLLAVEIFVLPGFGIAGISGLALIGASLVFSMQDFVVPDQPWMWDLFGRNLVVVSVGLIAAIGGIALLALFGPKLHMFDRLMLKTAIRGTAGGPDVSDAAASDLPAPMADASEEEEIPLTSLVGKRGVAVSVLRPVGRADIEGRSYSVESNGDYISAGTPVEVYRVRGNRIIVKSVARGDGEA
jgi:membrane-bound serine protease (ClpP class)